MKSYQCKVFVDINATGTEEDPKLIVIPCSKEIGMKTALLGSRVIFTHSCISVNTNAQATFMEYNNNERTMCIVTGNGAADLAAISETGADCQKYNANVTINLLP